MPVQSDVGVDRGADADHPLPVPLWPGHGAEVRVHTPPPVRTISPLTLPLASEQRKTITRATSSAVLSRPLGVCLAASSSNAGSTDSRLSVSVPPGATTLTRTP